MVVIRFEDPHGRTGHISASLDVDYAGQWREEVDEVVRRIEAETTEGARGEASPDLYSRLVLELPEVAPIVAVERTDEPVVPTRQRH